MVRAFCGILIVFTAIVGTGFPSVEADPPGVPEHWVKTEVPGAFTFYAPSGVKPISVRGTTIDSGVFESPTITVMYTQIGGMAPRERRGESCAFENFEVDGHQGRLSQCLPTDRPLNGASVMWEWIDHDTGLGWQFGGWCQNPDDAQILREIVRSLRFES
jgi:hypothetical protein